MYPAFPSFRLQPPGAARPSLCRSRCSPWPASHGHPPRGALRYWGFALRVQARRSYPAESSSLPTDRRFTSGCSPRQLALAQLPSITSPRT